MKPLTECGPYLTAEEAARYLRFPSRKAFYEWRRRTAVPTMYGRGRTLVFEKSILDRYVTGQLWKRKRSA